MRGIKHVLDASAVLAILNDEPGQAIVLPLLAESAVSTVNVAEVGSKLIDAGMDPRAAEIAIGILGIGEIIDFEIDSSWETARLRPITKALGLSLGDRACLALAIKLGVQAVTADKNWTKLGVCPILLIR